MSADYLHPQVPYQPSQVAAQPQPFRIPRALGPAGLDPSQPGALLPGGGMPVALPASNFPPAGSTVFDQAGDGDIAPGATVNLLTVTVPDGQTFRMAGIGWGADDEVSLGFLTWSITFGTDRVSGYNTEAAAIGSIVQLADIFVVVGSSTIVNIAATSDASAVLTYHYIVRLRGWFYSQMEAR